MNEAQGLTGIAADAAPQTTNARHAILKGMDAKDNEFYQGTFRPAAMQAKEAYSRGDMQAFGAAIGELSRVSPMPYQYQMEQDGHFTETFRSNKHNGYAPTGRRITPQQAMQHLDSILGGEQKVLAGADGQIKIFNPAFLAQAAQYRMGTSLGNAEALADESQWLELRDNDGNTLYAIPQNRHDDYSAGVSYMILDEQNGRSGHVNNLEELAQAGYSPVNQ
jgi:hypothetical protein